MPDTHYRTPKPTFVRFAVLGKVDSEQHAAAQQPTGWALSSDASQDRLRPIAVVQNGDEQRDSSSKAVMRLGRSMILVSISLKRADNFRKRSQDTADVSA